MNVTTDEAPKSLKKRSSYRLLKGTLHERPCVLTVDAVTSDCHQVTAAGHGVAKQSQVAVVDVGTIKGDDVVQLPLQSFTDRFDTQNLFKNQRTSMKNQKKRNTS